MSRLPGRAALIAGAALTALIGCASSPSTPSGGSRTTSAAKTTKSGVYTAAQATAGRELYEGRCTSCHVLAGLVTPDFKRRWAGENLWRLFSSMRETMPQDDPKSLSDAQYLNALAYILQYMRMPAGSTPLSADSVALKAIRVDTAGTPAR